VAIVTERTREKALLIFTPLDGNNEYPSPKVQSNTNQANWR
jgi:hypothetical protein